jgi:hypothetical protein
VRFHARCLKLRAPRVTHRPLDVLDHPPQLGHFSDQRLRCVVVLLAYGLAHCPFLLPLILFYARFTEKFGASLSETAEQPRPTSSAEASRFAASSSSRATSSRAVDEASSPSSSFSAAHST